MPWAKRVSYVGTKLVAADVRCAQKRTAGFWQAGRRDRSSPVGLGTRFGLGRGRGGAAHVSSLRGYRARPDRRGDRVAVLIANRRYLELGSCFFLIEGASHRADQVLHRRVRAVECCDPSPKPQDFRAVGHLEHLGHVVADQHH